jgi:hypothetical protein
MKTITPLEPEALNNNSTSTEIIDKGKGIIPAYVMFSMSGIVGIWMAYRLVTEIS